jgi:hypothetical protein
LSNGNLYDGVTSFAINSPTTPLTVGNIYTVNWLGTEYEVVAADVNGIIALGNLSIVEMGSDTTEPFLIGIFPDGPQVYTKESITEGNVSVKGENVHKIDKKYLPDSLQFGSETVELFTLDLSTEQTVHAQYDYIESQGYAYKQTNMAVWELTKNIGPVDLQSLIGAELEMNRSDYTERDLTITADDIVDGVLTKYRYLRLTAEGDLTIELEGSAASYTVSGYVKTLRVTKVTPINPEFLYTPDWNENAETAPAYIKNRTHWSEPEKVLVSDTVADPHVDFNDAPLPVPNLSLTVEDTYKVTWNGTEYEVVAFENDGAVSLGNGSLYNSSLENTGEPFLLDLYEGVFYIMIAENPDSIVTFSIKDSDGNVLLSDAKYGNTYFTMPTPGASLTIGNSYVVKWNGIVYELVAYRDSYDRISLGNDAINGGNDTGEPFILGIDEDNGVCYIYCKEEIPNPTVSIIKLEKVHKLDKKYLPEDLQFGTFENVLCTLNLDRGIGIYKQLDSIAEQGYVDQQTLGITLLIKNIGPIDLHKLVGGIVEMNTNDGITQIPITEEYISDDTLAVTGPYGTSFKLTSTGELTLRVDHSYEGGSIYTYPERVYYPELIKINPEFLYTPDWNESDPSAPTYIKNRTHYTEEVLVDLVPESQLTVTESFDTLNLFELPCAGQITVGNSYTVSWMNTDYNVVAQSILGQLVVLGNQSIISPLLGMELTDTGEPFLILYQEGQIAAYASADVTEGTIAIKGTITQTHILGKEYLPSGYPYAKDGVHEILPPSTVFGSNGNGTAYTPYPYIPLVAGNIYTVNWRGTDYEVVAIKPKGWNNNLIILGNGSL